MSATIETYIDKNSKLWLCGLTGIAKQNYPVAGGTIHAERQGKRCLMLPNGIEHIITRKINETTNDIIKTYFPYYGINGCAFFGNEDLELLIIPSAVEIIGDYAFQGSAIRHIAFAAPLPPEFSVNAFADMNLTKENPLILETYKGLKQIYTQALTPVIGKQLSEKTIVIIENSTVLITSDTVPSFKEAGEIVGNIEFMVTPKSIGKMAFLGHTYDTTLTQSYTNIKGSFPATNSYYGLNDSDEIIYAKSGLEEGYIFQGSNKPLPSTLDKSVNINAFYRRTGQATGDLTEVTLASTVKRLDSFAFQNNQNLQTITIQDYSSLTYIAPDAFYNLPALTTIQLYTDQDVTFVNNTANYIFSLNNNKTTIKDLYKIKGIYKEEEDCLVLIWADPTLTIEQYSALLQTAYNSKKIKEILPNSFPRAAASTYGKLTIPRNIEVIGAGAFYGNTKIKQVDFSNASDNLVIEDRAFGALDSLELTEFKGDMQNKNYNTIFVGTKTTNIVKPTTKTSLIALLKSPNAITIDLSNYLLKTTPSFQESVVLTEIALSDNVEIGDKIITTGTNAQLYKKIAFDFKNYPANLTFVSKAKGEGSLGNDRYWFGPLKFSGMTQQKIILDNAYIAGAYNPTVWDNKQQHPLDYYYASGIIAEDSLNVEIIGDCRIIGGLNGDGIQAKSGELVITGNPTNSSLHAIGNCGYETIPFKTDQNVLPSLTNIASWTMNRQYSDSEKWSSIVDQSSNNVFTLLSQSLRVDKSTTINLGLLQHPNKKTQESDFDALPSSKNDSQGSGIGYARAPSKTDQNSTSYVTIPMANITIKNLKLLHAEGYGQHAFGVGGGKSVSICHRLENCEQVIIKGGKSIPTLFGVTSLGNSIPEGGAAFGCGGKTASAYATHYGTIIAKNCGFVRAYGGAKAAAIGSAISTGVYVRLEDCKFGTICGGVYGAGIGSGMIWWASASAIQDTHNVKVEMIEPYSYYSKTSDCLCNIQGGALGAGIGSGGTSSTYVVPQHFCTIYIKESARNSEKDGELHITGGMNAAGIGTGYQTAGLQNCEIISEYSFKAMSGATYGTGYIIFPTCTEARNASSTDAKNIVYKHNVNWATAYTDDNKLKYFYKWHLADKDTNVQNNNALSVICQSGSDFFANANNYFSTNITQSVRRLSWSSQKIEVISNIETIAQPVLRWEQRLAKTMPQQIGYGSCYTGLGIESSGSYVEGKRELNISPLYLYTINLDASNNCKLNGNLLSSPYKKTFNPRFSTTEMVYMQ